MPLQDGLSRKALGLLAIKTLLDADTMAGNRVFEPRPWPARPDQFPMIIVNTPSERKVCLTRGQLQFTTNIVLEVVARVVSNSAESALADLDAITGEIEEAIFCTPGFTNQIQQFATVETVTAVNAEGREFIGEGGLRIDCELYQVFAPRGVPLLGVDATIINGPGGAEMAQAAVRFPNRPRPQPRS